MQTHKDLDVWKLSINYVTNIYSLTKNFPKAELYGLTSQIQRCAVSIPSNIAEGYGRQSKKECVRFLYISLGSIAELETQLIISKNLNYFENEQFENLIEKLETIRRKLVSLIRYVERR